MEEGGDACGPLLCLSRLLPVQPKDPKSVLNWKHPSLLYWAGKLVKPLHFWWDIYGLVVQWNREQPPRMIIRAAVSQKRLLLSWDLVLLPWSFQGKCHRSSSMALGGDGIQLWCEVSRACQPRATKKVSAHPQWEFLLGILPMAPFLNHLLPGYPRTLHSTSHSAVASNTIS